MKRLSLMIMVAILVLVSHQQAWAACMISSNTNSQNNFKGLLAVNATINQLGTDANCTSTEAKNYQQAVKFIVKKYCDTHPAYCDASKWNPGIAETKNPAGLSVIKFNSPLLLASPNADVIIGNTPYHHSYGLPVFDVSSFTSKSTDNKVKKNAFQCGSQSKYGLRSLIIHTNNLSKKDVFKLPCLVDEGDVYVCGGTLLGSPLAVPLGMGENYCVENGTKVPWVDDDGDGFTVMEGDAGCDNNTQINPGVEEICDGLDNDCDGKTDEALLKEYYPDLDNDGYGDDKASALYGCSIPAGHSKYHSDCNDKDESIAPFAQEICFNSVDENCDGSKTDGCPSDKERDDDGDCYCEDQNGNGVCEGGSTSSSCGSLGGNDCKDDNKKINPLATEICDGKDNDCKNGTDGDDATDVKVWYNDGDKDGYGSDTAQMGQTVLPPKIQCDQPSGYVSTNTDCVDNNNKVNPGASEICDTIDNDCDGIVDTDAVNKQTLYADKDGDSFGVIGSFIQSCDQEAGYVSITGDCNDQNALINPNGTEICGDTKDQDCSGADLACIPVGETDDDGDGFCEDSNGDKLCADGSTFGDCNDDDELIHRLAQEVCDGVDNDCDGLVDPNSATGAKNSYRDADSDGFGDPSLSIMACTSAIGYVDDGTDCDDTNPFKNPSQAEICENSSDENCDLNDAICPPEGDLDNDGDGYCEDLNGDGKCFDGSKTGDCDDANSNANLGLEEFCGDSVDNNCDGFVDDTSAVNVALWYNDFDEDGFGNSYRSLELCAPPPAGKWVLNASDCNDQDSTVHPGAKEICEDQIDQNCDTLDSPCLDDGETDADGDGFCEDMNADGLCNDGTRPDDCDDTRAAIFPGATEICDGRDNDCDERIDYVDPDQDGHFATICNDCKNDDPTIYPGAPEICGDGIDQSCDGRDLACDKPVVPPTPPPPPPPPAVPDSIDCEAPENRANPVCDVGGLPPTLPDGFLGDFRGNGLASGCSINTRQTETRVSWMSVALLVISIMLGSRRLIQSRQN